MNYPTDILDWKGKKFRLTWIRTDSLNGFTPVTQVYGICFNGNKEILISRQKGRESWAISGGTPEANETIEETLEREMVEEIDVKIKNIKILGVQKVEPLEEPSQVKYQVRCICEVDELLPQTPDPDGGKIWERKFVPAKDVTRYVKWGKLGKIMFDEAIKLYYHI